VLPARQLWEMYRAEKKSGNQLKHRPRTSPHRFANYCTLRDEGLISDEEFEAKKRVFLDRI